MLCVWNFPLCPNQCLDLLKILLFYLTFPLFLWTSTNPFTALKTQKLPTMAFIQRLHYLTHVNFSFNFVLSDSFRLYIYILLVLLFNWFIPHFSFQFIFYLCFISLLHSLFLIFSVHEFLNFGFTSEFTFNVMLMINNP